MIRKNNPIKKDVNEKQNCGLLYWKKNDPVKKKDFNGKKKESNKKIKNLNKKIKWRWFIVDINSVSTLKKLNIYTSLKIY